MAQPEPPSLESKDIVVFRIIRATTCAECQERLQPGRFLRIEQDRPLCLGCADLEHLIYLPSGDAALTRRARKYSTLAAVVVKFSRARKRYERQELLVGEAALTQAERECLADADVRARNRERAAARAEHMDAQHATAFAERIGELYPRSTPSDRIVIAERACARWSGRVGRSAAAKQLGAEAIDLAVRAHIRHQETEYDKLLAAGVSRDIARSKVFGRTEVVLEQWRQPSRD